MTRIQRFLMAVLPKRWADAMRAESQAWQMRCNSCGATRSVWDAGGIRWKAAASRKQALVYCPQCGERRSTTIERIPATNRGDMQ
ncbi:MAG: phage terminase large subunit family protein [Anaerolineae bacterium]|nr:hypothetical protein [Anaerolineae bacterium]MBK9095046.1 hypothetical protein [Anaerolineae bacterium]